VLFPFLHLGSYEGNGFLRLPTYVLVIIGIT
jgi:hypothetical protein